ncbi:MAG: FKBP-type peptidyl-prolyl cis-trans isomerase [Bacteroidales bacterium]|nr:FKBP-type peptidyl-prolyl cis-trans isomerase [Bacteroidales bacterium]
MNKTIRNCIIVCAAVASAVSCATKETAEANAGNKLYFDAWLGVHYPQARKVADSFGVYYLPENEAAGTGAAVTDSCYAIINYTSRTLEGIISETTSETMAKQIGSFTEGNYYGPVVRIIYPGQLNMGLLQSVVGMKVGAKRTAIIPTWLMNAKIYKDEKSYLGESSGVESAIYDIEIADVTTDIIDYQVQNIQKFSDRYLGGIDSTSEGFWYKTLKESSDTASLPNDTSVYVNYIGRLLDGSVFDTNIEDTAKVYHIYSSSGSYSPVKVTLGEEASDVTMGDSASDVVDGFGLTVKQMHAYEKGVGVFISTLGYDSSGSGSKIPGYAPLIFEIELVDEPE